MTSNSKIVWIAASIALTLILAACGGGGSPTISDEERHRLLSDPRYVRLEGILERADTLLVPSFHLRYSLSAGGETIKERLIQDMYCAGLRCLAEDGTEISVYDLIDPEVDIDLTEISLGSRDGFDTVSARGSFEVTDSVSGVTVTSAPNVNSYGFWGEYGFATAEIGAGRLFGRVEGTSFGGDVGLAVAYSVGDATGTNPTGMGSASWTGIAEAVATLTLKRRQGTATITIPDLSRSYRSRVSVDITLSGNSISPPSWSNMRLSRGRFASGERRNRKEYLEGHFHGPNHEETYGVFDTGNYIGAFGAKRDE